MPRFNLSSGGMAGVKPRIELGLKAHRWIQINTPGNAVLADDIPLAGLGNMHALMGKNLDWGWGSPSVALLI